MQCLRCGNLAEILNGEGFESFWITEKQKSTAVWRCFSFWQREKDTSLLCGLAEPAPAVHPMGEGSNPSGSQKKQKSTAGWRCFLFWQREKDSNPHKRSQSPVCYHYTIPLNARAIIHAFGDLSRLFSAHFPFAGRPKKAAAAGR